MAKCWVEIQMVDDALWWAFKASQKLDWFILYKNTNPLILTDEEISKIYNVSSAKDLKWIWIYKDWIPLTFEKTYYKLRNYILWYANSENFMWLFRLLYEEWETWDALFRKAQEKIRWDVDKFFYIIEWWSEEMSQQEYLFRLLRMVRDNEYNDATLFVSLFADNRENIQFKWLLENYFWIDILNPKTFRDIRMTIASKAWIYSFTPKFTWLERDSIAHWKSASSHTYYRALPDSIKVAYSREKFVIPEWVYLKDIKWELHVPWEVIYITNDTFLKFNKKEQAKLFDAVFQDYKMKDPWNAAALEEEVETALRNFNRTHAKLTFMAWTQALLKMAESPIFYALNLILCKIPYWFISLLTLNSFLHWANYAWLEWMNLSLEWDWWKFCERLWIFTNDISLSKLVSAAFKAWDYKDSLVWVWAALKRWSQKIADAQFFNVADWLMASTYRYHIAQEYIMARFPHINSLEWYINMVENMSRNEWKKEIERLVKYIDDTMYHRFNNSIDTKRYNKWWYSLNKEWLWYDILQEHINWINNVFKFYRRFMINYSDNVLWTIKEWWRNWVMQRDTMELMEKYFDSKMTWEEISDIIDNTFLRNQDLAHFLQAWLFWFWLAKMIERYDIHWNWYDEWPSDAVALNTFLDLYQLFFFPLEAVQKTWMWMWITSMFDAVSTDLWIWDNIKLIWWYESDTYLKQLTKSQWILKWIWSLVWDLRYNQEQRAELSRYEKRARAWTDLHKWIHWFWYYLLDDISRQWFEMYTPKTQTALLHDIFWVRPYSMKFYDDIYKKQQILKVEDFDTFVNYLTYHLPFVKEYNISVAWDTDWVKRAMEERWLSPQYRSMIEWKLPLWVTNQEYVLFYNMMTQFNPSDLDDIDYTFLTDLSWENDDLETVHPYEKEAAEKIWNKLMLNETDPELLSQAIKLLNSAEEKYQAQALQALLYLEADTPWAWQKLLWYWVSAKAVDNIYRKWKYWRFYKNDNWEYSVMDNIKIQEAWTKEKIELAKKYFNYEFIVNKEIWAQAILKLAKDSNMEISEYIMDTNSNWSKKLWIYPYKESERMTKWKLWKDVRASTDLYEVFLMHTYATIAAAEWMPDWFKLSNAFNKLTSSAWRKDEKWKLTESWARSMMRAYNSLFELVNDMWLSNVEKTVIMSSALMQSDQFIMRLIEWKTAEEIKADPAIQTALHFLWWDAKVIKDLADRKISEVVQKNHTGVDPSEVTLSWATDNNKAKKHWYSNWKQYYDKHKYIYDQIKYMTSKYHKYYDYLYTPKTTNVKSYYSKAERDVKAFWPGLASIKWSTSRKRRNDKQQKEWWSLTQRRGKARPFTNWWDLDKIPDRKTKPKNRRTRSFAVGSKLWNKLIPWRRRYIKARQRDIPTIS